MDGVPDGGLQEKGWGYNQVKACIRANRSCTGVAHASIHHSMHTKSIEHGYASKAQARADGDAGLPPPYQKVRVQDDAKQEEGQPAVEDHSNSKGDRKQL